MRIINNKHLCTLVKRITVPLSGIGKFTATAHKITDKGILFVFDDCIAQRPMNRKNTNEGGFEASDLKKWINTELLSAFPDWLRDDICDLSIPTVGELFGHSDEWGNKHLAPDGDEELELMKLPENRVACYDNVRGAIHVKKSEWVWLRNAENQKFSTSRFACVADDGALFSCYAACHLGVRPEFLFKGKERKLLWNGLQTFLLLRCVPSWSLSIRKEG